MMEYEEEERAIEEPLDRFPGRHDALREGAAAPDRLEAPRPRVGRAESPRPLDQSTLPPPPCFLPGDELHGHTLRERIGVGGFGEVWRAENLDGESFALKFCRGLDPDSIAAARREIALFDQLRQGMRDLPAGARRPPIVALKQSFLSAEPPAIAMEYVAGGDLRRFMRSRDFRPLALDESLGLVGDLLDALAFAHDRGVAHRDLSPENVLFDPAENRWKIADFGLGTAIVESELSLARSGASSKLSTQVAGKLHYMAPEAQRGAAGPAADLYSLGVIWAQLLSGSLDAGLPATWTRRVPADSVPILERCLEERPEDRWTSAHALRDAIAALRPTDAGAAPRSADAGAEGRTDEATRDALAAEPARPILATAPLDPSRAFRVQPGRATKLREVGRLRVPGIYQFLVSPDGGRALVGHWDGKIAYWDLEKGVEIGRHEPDRWGLGADSWNHKFLAITREGKRVLFGEWDGSLRVVDAADGRMLAKAAGDYSFEPVAAISPDGARAILGDWGGKIREYDMDSGRFALGYGGGHQGRVVALAISARGGKIVSGGADRKIRVWRRGEGAWNREFARLPAAPSALAISPDETRALSGGKFGLFRRDAAVREWDLETGEQIRAMKGHLGTIARLAYSPDGRLALSGSNDRTIRLWDLATGEALSVQSAHRKPIVSLGFDPSGEKVFSASKDGLVVRWAVERG